MVDANQAEFDVDADPDGASGFVAVGYAEFEARRFQLGESSGVGVGAADQDMRLCITCAAQHWWVGFAAPGMIDAPGWMMHGARELGWRYRYPFNITWDVALRVAFLIPKDGPIDHASFFANGALVDFLVGPKQPKPVWMRPEVLAWFSDEAHARLADWLRGDDPLPNLPALTGSPD